MARADHVGEELQEERGEQQADVHAVHIGVGGDDHLVVTQVLHVLLDVERRLQEVELLVLVDHLLREPVTVQRLAPQREDRLRTHVARGGDRTRGRVALRNEDHRLLGQLVLVREVDLAVAQLAVVERDLLGRLARLLLDARDGLALLLVLDNLLLQRLRRLGVFVQVVVEVLAQEIDHEVAHRDPGLDLLRAELDLGLRLEDRVGDLHRDGRNDRRADVRRIVVLVIELLDGLGDTLAEGRLVRTALRGVLAVHEREVALAVARAVGDGHLDVVAREVDRRIERILGHVLVQQVEQSVLRDVAAAVEAEREAQVQVGIVLDHLLDVLEVVGILPENLLIDAEGDVGAVLLRDTRLPAVALLEPLGEGDRAGLAVAHRARRELTREHVHGLDAHAVQAHGLLEGRAAVLAARVHLGNGRRQRLERNAAAEVAHRDDVVLDRDVDLAPGAHDELIDRVIDDLLDQHVDAVVGLRAVAQFADVHARAQADVFPRRQRHDGVVAVGFVGIRIE